MQTKFLSTPSARRATPRPGVPHLHRGYFYPRPPRGGRRQRRKTNHENDEISIHALREEGDSRTEVIPVDLDYFYPRPPRGGRHLETKSKNPVHIFLSTPSARRATCCLLRLHFCARYFYPRPPRGGRPCAACALPNILVFLSTPSARRATRSRISLMTNQTISIHALREEGDLAHVQVRAGGEIISIHALREEGDVGGFNGFGLEIDFYPRPPRGGRPYHPHVHLMIAVFLSTPSARRATWAHKCGR